MVRIDDIYVVTYSAGVFDRMTYKTGLASATTFVPAARRTYRQILDVDLVEVRGTRGRAEVRYLQQAQQSGWPNYVADQVLSPGVPSIRRVDQVLSSAGLSATAGPHPHGATVREASGHDLAG